MRRDGLDLVATAVDGEFSVEAVRVGHDQCSFSAGDLELHPRQLGVEAEHALGRLAALEFVQGADVCGNRHGELFARARAGADDAGLARFRDGGAHLCDGPEQLHEGRDVVRADVEQRAGALLEEEVRVRVPRLGAGALHERERGERHADRAALDETTGRLDARAEERVRRRGDAQSRSVGRVEQLASALPVERERLLAPDVLAGRESLERHLDVHFGNGEVDDDLDGVVGEQLGDGTRARNAEGSRLAACPLLIDVGDEAHVEVGELREVLEILGADHTGADDADADLSRAGARAHASPFEVRKV